MNAKRVHYYLLIGIFALTLCVQIFYMHFDQRSMTDHDFHFTQYSIRDYNNFLLGYSWHDSLTINYEYPTLNLIFSILAMLFPIGPVILHFISYLSYLAIIGGGYKIGDLLAGKNVALLSAFIIATLPFFDAESRKIDFQIHAFTTVIWAFYFTLLICKKSWSYPRAIGLGLLIGVGTASHPTTIIYWVLLVPFLFLHTIINHPPIKRHWRMLVTIILSSVLVVGIFASQLLNSYLSRIAIIEKKTILFSLLGVLGCGIFYLGLFYFLIFMLLFFPFLCRLLFHPKRGFISFLLPATLALIPFCSIITDVCGQAMPRDFLYGIALAPPFLLSEINFSINHDQRFHRYRKLLSLLIVPLVVGGIFVKINALSSFPVEQHREDIFDDVLVMRSLQLKRDLGTELINRVNDLALPEQINAQIIIDGHHLKPLYKDTITKYILHTITLTNRGIRTKKTLPADVVIRIFVAPNELSTKKVALKLLQMLQRTPTDLVEERTWIAKAGKPYLSFISYVPYQQIIVVLEKMKIPILDRQVPVRIKASL